MPNPINNPPFTLTPEIQAEAIAIQKEVRELTEYDQQTLLALFIALYQHGLHFIPATAYLQAGWTEDDQIKLQTITQVALHSISFNIHQSTGESQ